MALAKWVRSLAVVDALQERWHAFGNDGACRDGFAGCVGGTFRLRHGRNLRLRLLDCNAAVSNGDRDAQRLDAMLTTPLLSIVSPWFVAGI
jgi:hypothetical protein